MDLPAALILALTMADGAPGAPPTADAASTSRYDVYASPQRLVALPDGRRMNLFCSGTGSPTVILEGGWSDSNLSWRMVQPLVARRNRVCAYDRAGLGFSDPAPGPRDTLHIVSDLEALLKAAGLKPPYVLVGYSMGSLAVRLFADRHLAEVAGMVLVEPSSEHQGEQFAAALPGHGQRIRPMSDAEAAPSGPPGEAAADSAALPPSVLAVRASQTATAAYQQTILAELVGMIGDGADQVASARRAYGALPLIVLTGADNIGSPTYTPAEVIRFKAVWNGMHDDLARLSSVGVHRSVAASTHLMVFEQPQAIALAIGEVADKPKN